MVASKKPDTEYAEILTQAFVLQKTGMPDAALKVCNRAIDNGQDNEEIILLAAKIYVEQGELNAARTLLVNSMPKFSEYLEIGVALGDICNKLGLTVEAKQHLRSVLDISPDHPLATIILSQIQVKEGDFNSVCTTLDNGISASRPDPWIYYLAATMLDNFGRPDLAALYLLRAKERYPNDIHHSFFLSAVGDGVVPERAPIDHLRELFDKSADNYDSHLNSIGNASPRHIVEIIEHLNLEGRGDTSILDAGCGTGMNGDLLRPHASWLEGVDVSPKMLKQAEDRGCYDQLHCRDMVEFCCHTPQKYDLIVLTDVLSYFGALGEILDNLRRCLTDDGHIAFSVELLDSGTADKAGFKLAVNGRYSHSLEYVMDMLNLAGYAQPEFERKDILRQEFGVPVYCMVFIARKRTAK